MPEKITLSLEDSVGIVAVASPEQQRLAEALTSPIPPSEVPADGGQCATLHCSLVLPKDDHSFPIAPSREEKGP